MPPTANAYQPSVFISFAGDDRESAVRMGTDLSRRGVRAFVDKLAIGPGRNIVEAIDAELAQSDYFVLLWSPACVDRPWVQAEWTAAFERELTERRGFLFVVRLARAKLPTLLSTRRYLDAFDGWDQAIDDLVSAWSQDRAVGLPVLPAPRCSDSHEANAPDSARGVAIYVRNRALSVAHVVVVPADALGGEFMSTVRAALALPDSYTQFGGKISVRFAYALVHANREITDTDGPLAKLGIADDAAVDLRVQMEISDPDSSTTIIYRSDEPTEYPQARIDALLKAALGHLTPH